LEQVIDLKDEKYIILEEQVPALAQDFSDSNTTPPVAADKARLDTTSKPYLILSSENRSSDHPNTPSLPMVELL